MVAGPIDETLRKAARHRGFRLVKSRVKTPGKSDYGKFGLIDAKGAPAFGQSGKTLIASAREIADFLREGEVSTWATSVATMPQEPSATSGKRAEPGEADVASVARTRTPKRYRPPEVDEDRLPRSRKRVTDAPSGAEGVAGADATDEIFGEANVALAVPTRRKRRAAPEPTQPAASRAARPKAKPRAPEPRMEAQSGPGRESHAQAPSPNSARAPALKIRKATRDDADAIADLIALIASDGDLGNIVEQLPAKRGHGVLVVRPARSGHKDGVIGVIAWSLMPTLHRGTVGRITAIVVAAEERRAGIGRQLLYRAVEAMMKDGARLIEAVSDIEIRNNHRFFRDLGFEQTGYRFARMP